MSGIGRLAGCTSPAGTPRAAIAPVAALRPGARTLAFALRLYQLAVSPLLGSVCRFAPSCSEYTRQAVLLHGAWRGLAYGLRRVARCHPLHPGGWDPVP